MGVIGAFLAAADEADDHSSEEEEARLVTKRRRGRGPIGSSRQLLKIGNISPSSKGATMTPRAIPWSTVHVVLAG